VKSVFFKGAGKTVGQGFDEVAEEASLTGFDNNLYRHAGLDGFVA
jgi:hypothetical protein